MKLTVVTNNSLIYDTLFGKELFDAIIFDAGCSADGILKISKNMISIGHKLMMSPFFGNIPPNEMPYKTVVLSEKFPVVDFASLNTINKALQTAQRSIDERPKACFGKNDLSDFKKNDLVIIERWLVKIYLPMYSKKGYKICP